MKIQYQWDNKIGPMILVIIKDRIFGFCLCHRKEERSIWFFGLEKILCSRCIGILNGGILGIILTKFNIFFSPIIGSILIVPMLIDGFSQNLNFRMSNNYLRLISGFLFGIGLVILLNYFTKNFL